MRALLGLLVLGGLFLMAAVWQQGHTERLRAQRRAEFGIPSPGEVRNEAWSTLVLGRPSGAAPIEAPEPVGPVWEGLRDGRDGREPSDVDPVLPYPPDYHYEVQPNDILGRICSRHYGTSHPKLVDAVARYNELGSVDAVRAGDVLLLPDRSLLDE